MFVAKRKSPRGEVRIGNDIIMPVQRENYVKSALRKEQCFTEIRTYIEITNETLANAKYYINGE